jgi:hypothetical protein
MATFTRPGYRSIDTVTAEVCGDYKDFGGSLFTITQAEQPGFLVVTGDDYSTFEIAYQDLCAAIDTEVITRQEGQP